MTHPDKSTDTGVDGIASVPLTAWWTLFVLLMLGLYSIADRPMVSLQVEALRKELLLTDLQVGLVQGLSVAIFAAIVGYPLAWLADRFEARYVLAGSVAVWSGSLALSAFARSFEELFLFNALVGAGEACLVPISLALIPQIFRGRQRHLANSIMVLGGRLGLGLVIALCGWMILGVETWKHLLPQSLQSLATWRLSLLALAVPGLVFLPLVLSLPVPRKAPRMAGPMDAAAAPIADVLNVGRYVRENATAFAFFFFGVAMLVMGIGCVKAFAPVVAIRQMGLTPVQAGNGMGSATIAATVVGFLIAQLAYWKLLPRFGPRVGVMAMIAAASASAVLALCLQWATTPTQLFVIYGLFFTTVMSGTLLSPTILQDITPAPIRARLAAITVTLNIVLGSLGPALVGAVSDQLKGRPNGLALAMAGSACMCMIVSALLLVPMIRHYLGAVAAARRAERVHQPMGAPA